MRVPSLSALAPVPVRTLVINVRTDLVTTRALLSAIDLVGTPLLLLNCDPDPESSRHFDWLQERYPFDLLDIPLRKHGHTLDWFFAETADEQVLLLDSDAEVRDGGLFEWMKAQLRVRDVFGAGFTEGPFWMTEEWLAPPDAMLYMERCWVPCVLLRCEHVRRAAAAGVSFDQLMVPNEFRFSGRVANILGARYGPPWGTISRTYDALPASVRRRLGAAPLRGLRWARDRYYGLRPAMACYDTAARVYEHLRYAEGLIFAGVDVGLVQDRVHHYGGVSRHEVYGRIHFDTSPADIEQELRQRLADRYGYAP